MRAAIFDLDRTLLPGASGPTISAALHKVGLTGGPVPGQALAFKFFDLFGENRATMTLARQGARAARGWARPVVQQAASMVGPQLVEMVQPWAHTSLARHRAQGDQLVLATTTPFDVLEPFAEAMGFDHVVATRYGAVDDVYDGSIDGHFVWGPGKLRAVRQLCEVEGIDLGESSAYSDSYFDVPLLNAAGHPVAVNPDPRLVAVAALRQWPIRHLDAPPKVPKVLGREPQEFLIPFMRHGLFQLGNVKLEGLENIPTEGPVILAVNHRSYFDPLAIGYALATVGRPARFLAKSELFDTPVVKEVIEAMGTIPVQRGSGSDGPLKQAAEAIEAGEIVVILPQGTIPRGKAFFDPELDFKPGTARLAKLTGAPVVPMGLWGTEAVWPRNAKLPKLSPAWDQPSVNVAVGPPVELELDGKKSDTLRIRDAVVALLPDEARQSREPTEAELAATMPKGAGG
ncbi:MAG: HAD-IB family hydrolase [Acidimicrobiales bacterium]